MALEKGVWTAASVYGGCSALQLQNPIWWCF